MNVDRLNESRRILLVLLQVSNRLVSKRIQISAVSAHIKTLQQILRIYALQSHFQSLIFSQRPFLWIKHQIV